MNLDELRSVQSKERQKDSLQNLRPSFYQEVGEYIADLEDERDRVAEQVDDPFSSPEVGRLTDEIETAKDVVEAIYERRMGKLVKQASLAAAGMAANDEGLTAEEADLFDDLVDRIESNKTRVLDVLEGVEDGGGETEMDTASTAPEEPAPPPEEPPTDRESEVASQTESEPVTAGSEGATDSSTINPADVMGGAGGAAGTEPTESPTDSTGGTEPGSEPTDSTGGTEPGSEPTETESNRTKPDANGGDYADSEAGGGAPTNDGATVDRMTVKITRDVGSILGVDDREYTLSSDDVVTLPEQNAVPLVDREAAEPLE
ncbi:hypothetical protein [Natrialba swarupiae]|uniref:GINS subunit domain-containing protein n=1 Tax=Natrialba swarupiae TaxID=2448032 RepID=A0A5D5AME0_9EURY|nr:hypothetical protein [Natrialba swarupiae]TYT62254.1 hypothetical protein FYC77_09905 [Natrialba swarupiae]